MKKATNWLWGMILITLGTVWGLNVLGVMDVNLFFPGWWTMFIIVPCFLGLFDKDEDKMGDVIGILIGGCLLLACQGVVEWGMLWRMLVPVALVAVGISMIFKDALKRKVLKEAKKMREKAKQKKYEAMLGGLDLNFAGEKFEGCELEATFGGIKCDLRGADIEKGALIKAHAVLGGIEIFVPNDVKVKLVSSSILGGASDNRRHVDKKAETTLYVDAATVLGGVEVK